MGLTVLQKDAGGLGVTVAEYRGATVAARFSNPQPEFGALRTDCGIYDLGYRAKISLTGSDRVRWLNGMVTNNIRDLATRHGVYSFLLNPQGRILGDLYAYNVGDSIMVDTDRSQIETILATFDHYIIMDDVEVKDLSESLTTLGIAGPGSRDVLAASGIAVPEGEQLQVFEVKCAGDSDCVLCTIARGDYPEQESYELWLAPKDVKKTWDALVAHGAAPVGSEALEMHRIVSGIPRYGLDIRDRDLPQETEQARALNFSKGCYIGQEIVERIRSRGAVHRKFVGLIADAGQPIAPGNKLVAGEKEVGEITSVAFLRLGLTEKNVALGYIRRELSNPGREVAVGGSKATIVPLPVSDGALNAEQTAPAARPA